MEARFGHDFSGVRVHADPRAAQSAEDMNARAYTSGQNVVFGPGQLAPETHEGRRLLAHELTHVVQQEGGHGSLSSTAATEAEARRNGETIQSGQTAQVASSAPAGSLQREDKPKVSGGVSTERSAESKTDGPTNKFSYEAFVKLPILRNGKVGSFSFLEDLKVTNKGTRQSAEPFPLSFSDLSSIQGSAALKLMSFELPPLKLGKVGELSLEGSLTQSGTLKQTFGDKGAFTQDLTTKGTVEGGFKSSSLLPSRLGTLNLGATLGATGTLQQTFGGDKPGFVPSATGELGTSAKFLSPLSSRPSLTLGGLLGNQGQLSIEGKGGLEAGISGAEGPSLKPSASVEVGLTGKRTGKSRGDGAKETSGIESFLKLKVGGEGEVDLQKGGIKSNAFNIGITGGVKF
jgi:hypothetical protein